MSTENKKIKITKGNIHDEYLGYHEKFKNKYGDKSIVLMQVGSFHEAYSTDHRGPNLFKLSELLNIVCTRKDKSVDIINEKNPYMLGFPSVALSKFLKILIDNQFTVIVIDQVSLPPAPRREVTGIYSPSTFIDNVSIESKYLMILYIEINQALNSTKNNISIGMCSIDSATGAVNYYESHGTGIIDENEALEEAQRYYHYYRPAELIVYEIDNTKNASIEQTKKKIINKIDILPNQVMFQYSSINPEYTKINYQIKSLGKIYKDTIGMSNPIEFFDMEKLPCATIALITGFDYIKSHNENLLNELQTPKYFDDHKYMILANNAQYQLNIVDYFNYDSINVKFQSLNDVINNCVTPMGKRYLKQRLCAPFTDPKVINNYYDLTDKIIKSSQTDLVRTYLKSISDLDKLFRKISIKYIQPYELFNIFSSFENIVSMVQILLATTLKQDLLNLFPKTAINEFNESMTWISSVFDTDKLKINNLIEVRDSFYNNGIHADIDDIQSGILDGDNFLKKLAKALEAYDKDLTLHIKYNDRDGYYLQTTLKRGKKLKSIIDKVDSIAIDENKLLDPKNLNFAELTGTMKITYPELNSHSSEMDTLYEKLNLLVKEHFYKDVSQWYHKHSTMFKKLINMIMQIDLVTNNAFTSCKYHYSRPVLNSGTGTETVTIESFINVKQLRHPIIERLIDYEYVPHDVELNNNIRGMMIYGPNSAGKSAIMKAMGLCLIMAQCGMYVPAEAFEYNVFTALYTRISGGDNLFRGQSSFMVEMAELRTILKKADSRSMVLSDEIAKGTTVDAATAIVAASIVKLSKIGSKFLFTSHLHELNKLKTIKELNNIRFVYLSVEQKGDELVFSRKLLDGTGEANYGITIAKYILDDPAFIQNAFEFRNELLEQQGINYKLVNDKKSLYNKDIYMDECYICSSEEKLEAHHINFQKDFKQTINGLINDKKKHLLKDDKANLVVLCGKCHDKLHNNEFEIKGLTKTTKGVKAIIE
jgi:DNA mismatch repair protein MutS